MELIPIKNVIKNVIADAIIATPDQLLAQKHIT